jgi:hypothetical protein
MLVHSVEVNVFILRDGLREFDTGQNNIEFLSLSLSLPPPPTGISHVRGFSRPYSQSILDVLLPSFP